MSAVVPRMRARMLLYVTDRTAAVLLCWMVAVAYGILQTMDGAVGIPCLWKTLFGVECPGCGLTRAWALLLRGDLAAAARANWLIFPVIAGFLHHSFVLATRRRSPSLTTTLNH